MMLSKTWNHANTCSGNQIKHFCWQPKEEKLLMNLEIPGELVESAVLYISLE